MQSPHDIGYLTSRGGLFFGDAKGAADPNDYLRRVQQAKERYLRIQNGRTTEMQAEEKNGGPRLSFH